MAWHPNETGAVPEQAIIRDEAGNVTGYRNVRVKLRYGACPPESWPAAGKRPPTRWTLLGDSHDIVEFEIA